MARKRSEWLVKVTPKCEVCKGRGERKLLIEGSAKGEVGDGRWKGFAWLVEIVSKDKVGERGGERGYRLIEIPSKSEIAQGGREDLIGMLKRNPSVR